MSWGLATPAGTRQEDRTSSTRPTKQICRVTPSKKHEGSQWRGRIETFDVAEGKGTIRSGDREVTFTLNRVVSASGLTLERGDKVQYSFDQKQENHAHRVLVQQLTLQPRMESGRLLAHVHAVMAILCSNNDTKWRRALETVRSPALWSLMGAALVSAAHNLNAHQSALQLAICAASEQKQVIARSIVIQVDDLHFTTATVSQTFADGRTCDALVADLESGAVHPTADPRMLLIAVRLREKYWTLDNHRFGASSDSSRTWEPR